MMKVADCFLTEPKFIKKESVETSFCIGVLEEKISM